MGGGGSVCEGRVGVAMVRALLVAGRASMHHTENLERPHSPRILSPCSAAAAPSFWPLKPRSTWSSGSCSCSCYCYCCECALAIQA
eukprot:COSAG04_NODE_1106_length_8232_cov_4.848641_4_plen_86_part_00